MAKFLFTTFSLVGLTLGCAAEPPSRLQITKHIEQSGNAEANETYSSTQKPDKEPSEKPSVTPVIPVAMDTPAAVPPTEAPKPIDVKKVEINAPTTSLLGGRSALPISSNFTKSGEINWSISGPEGMSDLGTIDSEGVYRSPYEVKSEFKVVVVATLASDPTIKSSITLDIKPEDNLFLACEKANPAQPIFADVYKLESGIHKLPDFSSLTKSESVCLDKFNIPQTDFKAGFPKQTDLLEWFGLRLKTTLIVPSDGEYQIGMLADDGAKLSIDGKVLIDLDGIHNITGTSRTIELRAGKHDFSVDWFQGPRFSLALQVQWKKPGEKSFTTIPASAFAPLTSTP